MKDSHDRLTIISMAVIASAIATLLHEGAGHGLTAWLRGDVVTELTSNHLSSVRPDRWVDAGGTIANLIAGTACLFLAKSLHGAATRYFFWLLAALNLLPGAGYFLFSGVIGIGDWQEIIQGSPHYTTLRIAMVILGLVLYLCVVRVLAINLKPFLTVRREYNDVARLPYLAACIFSCIAGAFDPLGLKLLFISTIPAAFGGSSGLLWADAFLRFPLPPPKLYVPRLRIWWITALIIGIAYIAILGPGIRFTH